MEVIKWWKNKHFCLIVLTLVLTVVIGGICGYFIPFPYNLVIILILCVVCGIIVRNKVGDLLSEWLSKDE